MVQYKLFYFPARGRAEVIRLVFAAAEVAYEDIRISGEEWQKAKPDMPLGQMPVLEVDGVKLPQSAAIGRYLARKFNMGGKTELDMYWADVYADVLEDIGKKYPFTEKDDNKKEQLKKEFLDVTLPEGLQKFEKLYLENSKGKHCFLLGDELSVADLVLITFLDFVVPMKPDILKALPSLAKVDKRVREVPRIKKWLDKRPQSQF